MALCVQITKGNGHKLAVSWTWWHVMQMVQAARTNSGFEQMQSIMDWPPHKIVMEHDWSCCDPSDRELFTIKKGWALDAWRDR